MAVHARVQPWATRLAVFGLLGTALALGVPVLAGGADCEPPVLLALLVAALAAAALTVRLPDGRVSLLIAPLLPAWLACGGPATTVLAFVGAAAGGAIVTRAIGPTALAAAGALVGAVAGQLVGAAILTSGVAAGWATERLLAGAGFAVAYWLAEQALGRLAAPAGLADSAPVPRSSLVANLLLLVPGTILADVLLDRGPLLFVAFLLLLVVALGLIALYLNAETARRGATAEQARLETIIAHTPEGLFAVGPDLALEWLNDTATRLTGWAARSAVGRSCSEIIRLRCPDGTLADHRAAFARAARSGQAVHASGTLQAPDGRTRAVVLSYTAVTDGAGGFEAGVGALREAEATAELDDRVADLEHELRSPLSTILGYTRLMRSVPAGTLDADRQAEFIGRIAESGDYMLRLVNNLLDLRRMEHGIEPLQLAAVRLETFLATTLVMVRPRADEKRIATSLEVAPDVPPLLTDELLARRALDNLLSNAVKYTPEGGSVRVTAARVGDGVAIAVSDTGIGLTDDERARLFERFFRGARPEARLERGTGLGLALVQEATRRLGGEVRVESAVGVGSTFTLWLPVRHPAAEAAGDPAPA